jgi:hypothetical protein
MELTVKLLVEPLITLIIKIIALMKFSAQPVKSARELTFIVTASLSFKLYRTIQIFWSLRGAIA